MPTTTTTTSPEPAVQPGGACRHRSRRYADELLAAANPVSLTTAAKAQGTTVATMTAVLIELVNYDVSGTGKAWPSHQQLADRTILPTTGYKPCKRTVRNAMKALEHAGVVAQHERKRGGIHGWRTSNLVRVNPVIAARHAHRPANTPKPVPNHENSATKKKPSDLRSFRAENILTTTKPPLPPHQPNTGSFGRCAAEDSSDHPPKKPRRRRQTHLRRPRQTRRIDTRSETAGKTVIRDAERLTGLTVTPAARNRLADLADRLLAGYAYPELQHALSRAPATIRHPAAAWEHRLGHIDDWTSPNRHTTRLDLPPRPRPPDWTPPPIPARLTAAANLDALRAIKTSLNTDNQPQPTP